ncbi:MAG TPA: thiamine pyrophosphate-dependent enzyme [Candidatus Thermoplasmatota archaeon]|nr:thiamine pyrophosphate-dependent enzyme [Candidatus Thermoplasmatota archaeon]
MNGALPPLIGSPAPTVDPGGRELESACHPLDRMLRSDRLPHIWCPGCGIGPVMNAYAQAVLRSATPEDKHVCVSGIGCTGRVAGYMNLDSYHSTHGRAIPFATGLKLANPELKVTVFSGDGDLFAIGGNHFIHAARRNMDLTVVCINNFNYAMTGGQSGPTTPVGAITTTSPTGKVDPPFNLPYLAASVGATFVARWTSLHCRQLEDAIHKALERKGFSFVEVISPCPVGFGQRNSLGEGLDEMEYYREEAQLDPKAALEFLTLSMAKNEVFRVGNFVDLDKPSFTEMMKSPARGKPKGTVKA